MKQAPLSAEAFVYWTVASAARAARRAGVFSIDAAQEAVNELEVLGNYTLSPVLARLCSGTAAGFLSVLAADVA